MRGRKLLTHPSVCLNPHLGYWADFLFFFCFLPRTLRAEELCCVHHHGSLQPPQSVSLWMSWRKGAEGMVLKAAQSLWKWGWSDSAPVAESLLVFTSNPLGTSCHSSLSSLFAPVPPSHFFVSHAVLRLSLFCSPAGCLCVFSFLSFFLFFFLNLISILSSRPSLSALDSHSSSVSSRLPENFTIALNDTWVSFDSSSSPDKKKKKRRLFCLPPKNIQEYSSYCGVFTLYDFIVCGRFWLLGMQMFWSCNGGLCAFLCFSKGSVKLWGVILYIQPACQATYNSYQMPKGDDKRSWMVPMMLHAVIDFHDVSLGVGVEITNRPLCAAV